MTKSFGIVGVAALAGLLAGCLGSEKGRVDCGVGDAVRYEGADYCFYAAPLIIEGFDCPPMMPFEFGLPSGDRICARDQNEPPGGPQGVYEAWEEQHGELPATTNPTTQLDATSPSDADVMVPAEQGFVNVSIVVLGLDDTEDQRWRLTVTDGAGDETWTREITTSAFGGAGMVGYVGTCNAASSASESTLSVRAIGIEGAGGVDVTANWNRPTVTRTFTCVENADAFVQIDYEATPVASLSWCEQTIAQVGVGDDYIVIDWQCPIAQKCGDDAVMAACPESLPGGAWYCTCDDRGYQRCADLGESNATDCPTVGAAIGQTCAHILGADACAEGAYCAGGDPSEFGPPADNYGTCTAIPALCNEWSCYEDADCPTNADAVYTCRGADRLAGQRGACRATVTPGACFVDDDCPLGWECGGATFGCDDPCTCGTPGAGADVAGQCLGENGFSNPGLWVPGGYEFEDGDTLEVFWVKQDVGTDASYIRCPTWELQKQTEAGYQTVAVEACEDGTMVELAPGAILPRGGVTVDATGPNGYGVYRLRGTYYSGCTAGAGPATCSGGPFERFGHGDFYVR